MIRLSLHDARTSKDGESLPSLEERLDGLETRIERAKRKAQRAWTHNGTMRWYDEQRALESERHELIMTLPEDHERRRTPAPQEYANREPGSEVASEPPATQVPEPVKRGYKTLKTIGAIAGITAALIGTSIGAHKIFPSDETRPRQALQRSTQAPTAIAPQAYVALPPAPTSTPAATPTYAPAPTANPNERAAAPSTSLSTNGSRTAEKSVVTPIKPDFSIDPVAGTANAYLIRSTVDGEIVIDGLDTAYRLPVRKGDNQFTIDGKLQEGRTGYIALRIDGKTVGSVRNLKRYLPHLVTATPAPTPVETIPTLERVATTAMESAITEPAATTCAPNDVYRAAEERLGVVQQLRDLECVLETETQSGSSSTLDLYLDFRRAVEDEARRVRGERGCDEPPEPQPVELLKATAAYSVYRRGTGEFKSVDAIVQEYGVHRAALLAEVDARGIERRGSRTTAEQRAQRRDYVLRGIENGADFKRLAAESGWSERTLRKDYAAARRA